MSLHAKWVVAQKCPLCGSRFPTREHVNACQRVADLVRQQTHGPWVNGAEAP